MMFSENFIIAVKVGGQVLRESGNLVSLPFGCEYTLLLKNLNSRRAMVSVSVDGNDATDGKLILAPNATLELERFIRNGNLNSGNRFKFIERTAAVESHRGIKEDDGLIRAEFWAEREVIEKPIVRPHYYDEYYPRPIPWDPYEHPRPWPRRPIISMSGGLRTLRPRAARAIRPSGPQAMASVNTSGITVAGSESHQRFVPTSGFSLETQSKVIVLQLRGAVGDQVVTKPVTVSTKPCCSTCGKKNKPTVKFCAECGTALALL